MPNEDIENLEIPGAMGADDLARGEAVLLDWQARLAGQAESQTFTGLNGAWVGLAVLKGVEAIRSVAGLEDRLRRIPADFYDARTFDDLAPAAQALLVVSRHLADARLGQTRVRVPVALAEAATEHRRRLVRMAAWEAEGDSAFEAFVADIKRGRGYFDLMDDLARLGPVITRRRAAFEKNRLYRADDAEVAIRLAGELGRALVADLSPAAQAIRSTQLRLYAILERAWRHTVRAVNLLRADEPDLLPDTLRAQVYAVRG